MKWFNKKSNIVVSIVIFVLVIALMALCIVINDKSYKLSKKNDELKKANSTITEYSSEIEEHKKTESEMQSQIDSITTENNSLKQQMTELAAKKKAASEAALPSKKEAVQTATQIETPPPPAESPEEAAAKAAALNQRIDELTQALALTPVEQQPAKEGVCYLTFDDGPSGNTPAILDILAKYNAKATFFVIGTGDLSILPRIVAEGHAVGLHANTHTYSTIYSGIDSYLSDLLTLSQKVEATIGQKVGIFRFPGGSSNTVSTKYTRGIISDLATRLPSMGYSYFDWNVSSGDADRGLVATSKIINDTVTRCQGKSSVCILMHDAAGKTTTVEALEPIIANLSAMGFTFEALTQETYGYHQKIVN